MLELETRECCGTTYNCEHLNDCPNRRDAAREHLTADCVYCGHPHLAHYRYPSCRLCSCNLDPLCWCGLLVSKHEDIEGAATVR